MTMMIQAVTYQPSDDDRQRMEQWRRMMDKQRSQGGIIDLSKDPHLVDWNWVGASIGLCSEVERSCSHISKVKHLGT